MATKRSAPASVPSQGGESQVITILGVARAVFGAAVPARGPTDNKSAGAILEFLAKGLNGTLPGQPARSNPKMTAKQQEREALRAARPLPTEWKGHSVLAGGVAYLSLLRGNSEPAAKKVTGDIRRAYAESLVFGKRKSSFNRRPREVPTDKKFMKFPDGPFWAKKATKGLFAGTPDFNQNKFLSMPIDRLYGIKTGLGAVGTPGDILACFCWGMNSSALLQCLIPEGEKLVRLVKVPVPQGNKPLLIVGCFGGATRGGSEGTQGIAVKSEVGFEQLEDITACNLCNTDILGALGLRPVLQQVPLPREEPEEPMSDDEL